MIFKIMIVLAVVLTTPLATANTYTLTPDSATASECRTMGMYGEFELQRYKDPRSVRGRRMVFKKSGEDFPLTQSKTNKNLYTTLVKCAHGCTGSMEVRLDLVAGDFLYKRNMRFDNGSINELCRGAVK